MSFLDDDVVGLIANKVCEKDDRKSFSEVCKQWCRVEGLSRSSLEVFHNWPGLPLGALTRFPNVVVLEVKYVRTEADLEFIAQTCPRLESITVHSDIRIESDDIVLGPKSLVALGNGCPQLSRVKLVGREAVGDSGVVALVHSARNLKALVLACDLWISDQALRAIGSASSISTLKLPGSRIKDVELGVLANGTSSISTLELVRCRKITDVGLGFLANGSISKTLKKLVLDGCNKITDSGVQLLRKMCSLERLDLSNCGSRITNAGGVAISAIQTLRELLLVNLQTVSNSTIVALAWNCPNLEILDLRGCQAVTGAGIRAFSGHKCLKRLVLLNLPFHNFNEADLESIALGCPSLESESVLVDNVIKVVHDNTRRVVKFISIFTPSFRLNIEQINLPSDYMHPWTFSSPQGFGGADVSCFYYCSPFASILISFVSWLELVMDTQLLFLVSFMVQVSFVCLTNHVHPTFAAEYLLLLLSAFDGYCSLDFNSLAATVC
ncbi:putative leucine-rich repeat domain, L domain-containing protein [Rosa chinensis]|uniref:Putative leucine-rich repeat domain, L domain-containing protein n=1 Tax=Rosa chinensis TaxID=74649 RepID=A0A2P6QKY1_ROSCH|nr:putative leucine-rich repeat domain, L domain-containing protein [Rosa chinensis]